MESVGRLRARFRRRLPVLLTGLFAWTVNVLSGATVEGAPPSAKGGAVLALSCLLGATLVRQNLWSVVLGIEGYFLASLISWWALRSEGLAQRPGLFGLLAWIAYALAWGALSKPEATADGGATGEFDPSLVPRSRGRPLLAPLVVLGLCALPLLLQLPSIVRRDAAAILGEVVTLAVIVLLVTTCAEVGARRYATGSPPTSGVSFRRAGPQLVLVVALLVAAWVVGFEP